MILVQLTGGAGSHVCRPPHGFRGRGIKIVSASSGSDDVALRAQWAIAGCCSLHLCNAEPTPERHYQGLSILKKKKKKKKKKKEEEEKKRKEEVFVWMTQSKLMQPHSSFSGVVCAAATEQCHVLFGDWRRGLA